MSITKAHELTGMQSVSHAVGTILKKMRQMAKPGISTKTLDDYGATLFKYYGANSAPRLTYGFPGWTCISVNNAIAHGIPTEDTVLKTGDLVNIDVSGELNGYWSDNGCSFVVGEDIHQHQRLVNASREILNLAIDHIKGGIRIAHIGKLIESEAKKRGYKVIKNLTGHGIGKSLHEPPEAIANCYDKHNKQRFKKHSVIALETFISTHSTLAYTQNDGWTLRGNKGGYVAQHEHTMVITDDKPIILTASNDI